MGGGKTNALVPLVTPSSECHCSGHHAWLPHFLYGPGVLEPGWFLMASGASLVHFKSTCHPAGSPPPPPPQAGLSKLEDLNLQVRVASAL